MPNVYLIISTWITSAEAALSNVVAFVVRWDTEILVGVAVVCVVTAILMLVIGPTVHGHYTMEDGDTVDDWTPRRM